MFQKLYIKFLSFSQTKFAPLLLSLVAFFEAIVFPIPPDIMLIPMSLVNKQRALIFASLTTFFSVLGGMTGYLIGSIFWNEFGEGLIDSLGYNNAYLSFARLYDEYGLIIVVIGALTPFPFKIVAILSGAIGYPFLMFVIAAIFSRGLRFYIIAIIIYVWGDQINYLLTKYLTLIFTLLAALIIGVYWYLI